MILIVLLPYRLTLLSNQARRRIKMVLFYYPIDLHYSQTIPYGIIIPDKFYYPIDLHYSQTSILRKCPTKAQEVYGQTNMPILLYHKDLRLSNAERLFSKFTQVTVYHQPLGSTKHITRTIFYHKHAYIFLPHSTHKTFYVFIIKVTSHVHRKE